MTDGHSFGSHKENRTEHREHVLRDVESILLFIKNRLESNTSVQDIKAMLLKAGFDNGVIEMAMKEVHRVYSDTHQDIAAGNGFMPLLISKDGIGIEGHFGASGSSRADLFSGRMHRADFILGFLFFFSIGILLFLFLLTALQSAYPNAFLFLLELSSKQIDGLGLFIIPVALAPITIIILSIISRRLHDIGLPDMLAVGFLFFFLVPTGGGGISDMIVIIQLAWAILFTVLLVKKGDKGPNRYGPRSTRKGPFFVRLFAYSK